jgi:hypothetical protein
MIERPAVPIGVQGLRRLLPILSVVAATSALLSTSAAGSVWAGGSRDAPTLSLPPDSTVMTTHPLGAVVTYSAAGADWKSRRVPVTCTPASGSLFSIGVTTVTCSATDKRGVTASGSFVVTVIAESAPAVLETPPPRENEPGSGAGVTAPVRIAWRPDPAATYYNFQLFRVPDEAPQPEKVLSTWPEEARFTLRRRWTYDGRPYRLAPGTYRWYVWPGYGSRSERRFGPLLQQGRFTVAANAR